MFELTPWRRKRRPRVVRVGRIVRDDDGNEWVVMTVERSDVLTAQLMYAPDFERLYRRH